MFRLHRLRMTTAAATVALSIGMYHSPAQAAAGFREAASVPLAPVNAEIFSQIGEDALDAPSSGRIPNYLRALAAQTPGAVQPFARLFKTVMYGGTVAPEVKAAMGWHIARMNGSDYLAAHLARILNTSEKGRSLLSASEREVRDERDRIALQYAIRTTRDIHGVSDAEFARARAFYNDSQLIELTAVTSFFNYFSRFCQGANLPLESWAKEAPNALPVRAATGEDTARVTLASDAEMRAASRLVNPTPETSSRGLGIGIANSQRAMLRVPDIGDAWWTYMRTVREGAKLTRTMQLHISFAVSMLNGCRYCTVHQVVGLRRQGVEVEKLVAMKRDDSALSAKELAAVTYARKLTRSPGSVQESDYAALRAALGDDREAFDALLQTCAFSFMNRFTDGLRLPSEDEAVKIYQEVYGEGSYRAYRP